MPAIHRARGLALRVGVGLLLVLLVGGAGIYARSGEPAESQAGVEVAVETAPSPRPLPVLPKRHSVDEPAAPSAVAGWVIDGLGQPLEGVSIHRLSLERKAGELLAVTETDGAFRLSKETKEGEELMLMGDSVFASTFRHGLQEKGLRVMATRRMSLSVQVTHGGKAAAAATVELHDGSGPTGRILTTDREGLVHFEDLVPGAYELWAHQEGLASRVVRESRAQATGSNLELILESASKGRGRIVDAQGRGLRASLRLVPENEDYAARFLESEEDGSFVLDALLPGRWHVKAMSAGYVSASDFMLQAGSKSLDFEIALEKGGSAWGRVLDQHGTPVPDARVVIRSQAEARKVAASSGAVAAPTMRWVHPLATKRSMPSHHSRRFGAGRDGVRPTECGRGHCGVDIGTERGRVVHAVGAARVAKILRESKGKAGRYIVLEHEGGLKSFYMHLDEIHAELEVGQRVQAGDAIGSIGRTGVIRSGPHLHFAISQNHGGRTWFIDPEPILEHAVVLPHPGELSGRRIAATSTLAIVVDERRDAPVVASSAEPASRVLVSDAQGRFRRDGLGAGRYAASAYHAEMAPGTSKVFTVKHERETDEVIVRLRPGVEIYGVVRGPDGPIPDALVVAEEVGSLVSRAVAKTHADSEGRFRLRPLSGRLSLRVSAPGYGEGERKLALTSAKSSAAERQEHFVLSARNRQLEGQIRDPAGFPVRGASVRIVSGPSARGARATSDEYGNFVIPGLARGSYRLLVLSAEFPSATKMVGTEGTHEIKLTRGASILFRLLDAHNREALSGVRVQALGPGEERSSMVTNPEGVALFPKMRAGQWKLKVQHKGYVRHQSTIVLEGLQEGKVSRAEHTAELSRGASLAGILRDDMGDRVASARVWVGDASTTTDQDGRFKLSDVPTGSVQLRADRKGETGELSLELSPGDEIVTLDLRLQ